MIPRAAPYPAPGVDAMPAHFSELFCRRFHVAPEDYRAALLRRTLYPGARLVRPLLRWLRPNHFSPDHEFIDRLGRIQRWREFAEEAREFSRHPANRQFLRETLCLRVSVGRTQEIVQLLMDDAR